MLVSDVKYCLRALLRTPLSCFAIIVTLAIGIGGCTAMFTVVQAVLVNALPFPQPDRLVAINEVDRRTGSFMATSIRGFSFFDEQARSNCQLAAYWIQTVSVTANGVAERTAATIVTPGFFAVLKMRMLAGRSFQQSDADGSVVLSAAYARQLFGTEPSAVGQVIAVDGNQSIIVGVAPSDFQFPAMTRRLWRMTRTDYFVVKDNGMFASSAPSHASATRRRFLPHASKSKLHETASRNSRRTSTSIP